MHTMDFGQEPVAWFTELVCYRWDWPFVRTLLPNRFVLMCLSFILAFRDCLLFLNGVFAVAFPLQNCSIKCESWPTLLKCYTPFSRDWNPTITLGLINWSIYRCANNQSTTCWVGLVLLWYWSILPDLLRLRLRLWPQIRREPRCLSKIYSISIFYNVYYTWFLTICQELFYALLLKVWLVLNLVGKRVPHSFVRN